MLFLDITDIQEGREAGEEEEEEEEEEQLQQLQRCRSSYKITSRVHFAQLVIADQVLAFL